jgi:MFS family permease
MSVRRSGRALVAGVALVVAAAMPAFLVASLAPRIRVDFEFSDSTVGLAVGLFYAACALISTPCGHLVERIGATTSLRLGAASTAASTVALAALADSAVVVILLLVAGGLGNAIAGPAVSALLQREVAGHRHGLAFGAQQAGAPIGSLLAGLALPAVAIPLGWRWAFAGTAVLAVGAAAMAPVVGPAASPSDNTGRVRRRFTAVHALGLAGVLASAASVGLVTFLVLYSVDNGLGEGAAGLLLAGLRVAAAAGRIVLGMLGDRPGEDPLRPVTIMLVGSAGGYLALLIGVPASIVIGAVIAGGLGWAWPAALTLAVVQRSPDAPAWAVGVLMSGLFTGAVAGPLLVGLFAEADLFAAGWIACAAFALAAAATIVATGRRSRAG